MKRKILNLLWVSRVENKDTWWHRLAQVLVVGSTAAVLIAGCLEIADNLFYPRRAPKVEIPKSETLTFEKLKKLDAILGLASTIITADNIFVLNGEPKNSLSDRINYIQDKQREADQKQSEENIKNLIQESLFIVLVVFLWFLFWESVVYRTLLYVIYGRTS